MLGFTLNGTPYFYQRNLQGDVIGIFDANGAVVASYEYDAWGNITQILGQLAFVNPIRYRGYYFDTETGYYYCQSLSFRYTNGAPPALDNVNITIRPGDKIAIDALYQRLLPQTQLSPEQKQAHVQEVAQYRTN